MKHETPPREAIRIEDRWYVLATSSHTGEAKRVLKHGESFALFDRFGDMPRVGSGEHGLYHQGTRFLSRYELRVNGERPILLNSHARRDNTALTIDCTNADIFDGGDLAVMKGTVHLSRSWILWDAACHERLEISNFGGVPVVVRLAMEFGADFADIFEVRGFERQRRGSDFPPAIAADDVKLGYMGLDGVRRCTEIRWSCTPARIAEDRADFEITLPAHGRFELDTRICCEPEAASCRASTYAEARAGANQALHADLSRRARMASPNEQFNAWIERSGADLAMLTAGNPEGGYPYAGVPWYSVPFGRDGLITALHYLWVEPDMARGVLRFLAATQATERDPQHDAEPGKIVHEMRKGELAALGEIPFGRYYGTIDATPLFVVLAGEYHQRTGDRDTLASLWPHVERALDWMDRHGDVDGDGFIEYQRRSRTGLANQGWKDSEDSVFHADGRLAAGPIALAEVQAYAYLARMHAARLAESMGEAQRATRLRAQARALQERFESAFWLDELGTYAIALDGDKQPCRVRSSNVGHVLWSGIAGEARAARVGAALMHPDSFSGWGVRTIARGEARYNPMSYHNGSIWPHDNAMAAMGLARYGMKEQAAAIFDALYEASLYMDLHRLPELFCGFPRRDAGEAPTLYPVACSPQAWAASTPFYLLKACLGLSFRLEEPRIRFLHPRLPRCIDRLELTGLRAGEATVDVRFERHGVKVLRKAGDIEVSVVL